jgi:DedD protein
MSFFSFRRGQPSSAKVDSQEPATDSVEVVRRRARHRLIGAAVLVLSGVIGFPLLFDSQPRPVPVDIAIEIPSRSTVKPGTPIAAAPAPALTAPVAPAVSTNGAPVAAQASLQDKEEIVAPARPVVEPATAPAAPVKAAPAVPVKAEPKAEAKAEPKAEAKAPSKAEGKSDPGKSDAGKSDAGKGDGRVVVQVGAYADEGKVREVRQKLEKSGFKTYTQVVETSEGKRTRVRVGPFASRTEAEKAAAKIKSLNLPASLLAL